MALRLGGSKAALLPYLASQNMDSYPRSVVPHRNIIALPLPPTLLEDDFVQYSYSDSMKQKPRDRWPSHASPFYQPSTAYVTSSQEGSVWSVPQTSPSARAAC